MQQITTQPKPNLAAKKEPFKTKIFPSDLIEEKNISLKQPFGKPISNVQMDSAGNYFQNFETGCIISTPKGVFEIHGDIYKKWIQLGREKFAVPITDETGTPDKVGRYNHFTNGASIYWTPATGAQAVYGAIRTKWAESGWETSSLGYPTSDEMPASDGVGRISNFQNGSIYWAANTGAIILKSLLAWQDIIVTGGIAALGGNYEITFYQNGDFVFSGHMHNSGIDSYDSQLAVAIVDGLGNAYTLEHKGHTDRNVPVFGGGNQSDDWENRGNNPAIAKNWGQVHVARYARVFNYDSQIAGAAAEAAKAAAQAAVTALIALV